MHEILANDTEPVYIPKRSHSITAIATRLREEEELRRKILNESKRERSVYMQMFLCTLFAGMFVVKERTAIKKMLVGGDGS